MRRMDELHMAYPFYGSRLDAASAPRGRPRAGTGSGGSFMGMEATYRRPRTSVASPEHRVFPYLLRGLTLAGGPRVVRGGHGYQYDGTRFPSLSYKDRPIHTSSSTADLAVRKDTLFVLYWGTTENSPARRSAFPPGERGSYWSLSFPCRAKIAGWSIHPKQTQSESYRGLSQPLGIHLNYALGLSNEVGPPHTSDRCCSQVELPVSRSGTIAPFLP